ncbi:MAG: NCS2 family permease [Bacteroidales bacterium]|nr:NCS2 family permease [Bacteroidales bacterium]
MLEKLFGFNKQETTVRTEIFAGITTFLTMAYILAVNPNILGETGMDKGALFTTTVIMAAFATGLMAIYAKLPFALAPGMGLNAFFAYTICLTLGFSWQFALTAVLLEGIIFIILTATNLREKIVKVLPESLKTSISVGIGLYIAFIGLKNAGVIVGNSATLVGLGDLTQGSGLLTVIGLVITSALLVKDVKGALFIGIIATALIGIPMGETKLNGVFSTPPSIEPIFWKFDWNGIFTKDMFYVIFTLLFVDLFGCIGTIIGVANQMETKDGKYPPLKKAFMVDAIATTTGAMMGTSAVTTYVESASGVKAGGKSGLTAFSTAVCFLVSLFLAPVFLAIPSAAVAPVLVLVGLMMMSSIKKIEFFDYSESIPAFICIVMMPLTYSIAEGIVLGHLSYVFVNSLGGNIKKLSAGMFILAAFFILKFLM